MKERTARCPTCGRPVPPKSVEFPFCSRRCRLIDLGQWLDGKYRIPGEEVRIPDEEETN